jgi:RNA recognition motif-containing protein
MSEAKSKTAKVFIGGLSWDTTDQAFYQYFSKFGDIRDAVVMRDKQTGGSRGFGFVTYNDASVVDKVLLAKDVLEIDGKKIDVKPAVPKEQMQSPSQTARVKKLFVGGLPTDLSEQEFRSHFAQFGTIVDSTIMVDGVSGRSRGFGFVTYDSEDAVDLVLSKEHTLGGKRVDPKRAVPKTQMDVPPRVGGGGGGGGGRLGRGGGGFENGFRNPYGGEGFGADPYGAAAFDPYGLNPYSAAYGGGRGAPLAAGNRGAYGVPPSMPVSALAAYEAAYGAAGYGAMPSSGRQQGRVDRAFHPYR